MLYIIIMTLQDIFTYFASEYSVLIESEDQLENLRQLLDENYGERGIFFNENSGLEQAIQETISEEAIGNVFDTNLTRKAFELGYYPMSMEKRILNKNEVDAICNPTIIAKLISGKPLYRTVPVYKYHSKKLIIPFDRLHITKKLKGWLNGKFSDYTMTFNRNFDLCIEELLKAYPDTWLSENLIEQYKEIHENPDGKISVDSVEIWHNGKLVAGEIGFITKNAYASLSGFHNEDDIGTAQMCVLGLYLKNNGFAYWDLGMELDYKYRYGAVPCDRDRQEELYASLENKKAEFPDQEIPLSDFIKYL